MMKTKAGYVNLWQQKPMSTLHHHVNAKDTTRCKNPRQTLKLERAFLARRIIEVDIYVNDGRSYSMMHHIIVRA